MKRLLVIGLTIGILCSNLVWAQIAGSSSSLLWQEDDPNDPNEPLLELSGTVLQEDPNDPNEPLSEWTAPVALDDDPNDPNEPLSE